MVTGILVAMIAASILRMSMFRYQMGYRSAIVLQEKRDAQGLLAQITAAWGSSGQTCAAVAIPGFTYSGTAGTCGCSYTPSAQTAPPTIPSVTTNGTAAACQLVIVSADRK
jgi:hypothetical protein